MNNYTVYCHWFPNGKTYIGITQQGTKKRWKNGCGYDRSYMARAVKKYGWENIRHIILASQLDHDTVCELEQYYIKVYQSNDREHGYNCTLGGEGKLGEKHSQETRQRIANIMKQKWQDPEYRNHMSEVHKGHSPANKGRPLPQWQKELISKVHKGLKQSAETIAKRVAKLRGKKHTDAAKLLLSQKKTGVPLSAEHKHALKIAWRMRRSIALIKAGVD